ncbi:N-acetylglucosamine-6-phosphate deacetylase [symbiont of Argiope bruennichi]|uniref:N-acetylglucosamine-6-phosphate deacetylase n=1 Tax=symbiont of Argiope bruennichi TaxID=2810479 RepID=UPI003DA6674A
MKKVIKNINIVLLDKIIFGWILFDEKIINICEGTFDEKTLIDKNISVFEGSDCYLYPGFIDIHINGCNGIDFNDLSNSDIDNALNFLPSTGVTSFLATLITDAEKMIEEKVSSYKKYQNNSSFLGVYLEGPFISKEKKGAHNEKYIKKFDENLINSLNKNKLIKIVAYAIENATINNQLFLEKNNIIGAIGHSNGTFEEVTNFVKDTKINLATHLYNAMSSFDHRKPGIVPALLYYDNFYCELITDLYHVDENILKLTYKIKGKEKIIIITDGTKGIGLNDGDYNLASLKTVKKGYAMYLKNNLQMLAGSASPFIRNFKIAKKVFNCTLSDLVYMTSFNAAKLLKINHLKGEIKTKKEASFLVLKKETLDIKMVFCCGKLVYKNVN